MIKTPHFIRALMKKRQQVYIFPTRMGGYLIGLIFLMLLMSVGYSNNLLLIFTLVLFAINLIWLIQSHFHLHALLPKSVRVTDGHAGDPQLIQIDWARAPEEPLHWEVWLEDTSSSLPVRMISTDKKSGFGEVVFENRGFREFKHIRIKTERPFGLYQVWCYYKVDVSLYVFPRRLKSFFPLEVEALDSTGETGRKIKGPHDFWALAPYQGEESRKISWKHYARSGELMVKEGEEHGEFQVRFRLQRSSKDKEFILSKLATQMCYCYQTQVPFSFDGDLIKIPLGSTEKHLSDCLKELAKC